MEKISDKYEFKITGSAGLSAEKQKSVNRLMEFIMPELIYLGITKIEIIPKKAKN